MKSIAKIFMLLMLAPACSFSQAVVNLYARVTAVSGTSVTITGATGSFTAGAAIIMQVQDSTMGSNTGNNTSFGNLASIQSAGLAEMVDITSATASSITLSTALTNSFHFNSNSRVQIISYPTLGGGGNYTLTGGITAPAWNGSTGGVVAFKVSGILTLNSNITADGRGLRGGAVGNNAASDYTCDPARFYDGAAGVSTTYYGYKGEGVHNTNGVYTVARGKIVNGGGGGNYNNTGGGGGGNLTAGGSGGMGWSCTGTTSGAGVGGIDLSSYISGTRVFMGGGGGGGQQNNNVGTAGANGGGIILIKATAIQTSADCNSGTGNITISAKGNTAGNSGNDGAGGGGAGGSIVLQVASYSVSGSCPININTSGGNGGTVNDGGAHGGGAGGGKGVTIFSGVVGTPANTTVTDVEGTGGADANYAGAPVAANGATSSGSGIGSVMFTPSSLLPVPLSNFQVAAVKTTALLQWKSGAESAFSYYQVERSANNGASYIAAAVVAAKGSNTVYSFTDKLDAMNLDGAKIYYRLKMVDRDGSVEYSAVKLVSFSRQANTITIKSFPNPATTTVYLTSGGISSAVPVQASIHDMQGRVVKIVTSAAVISSNTVAVSLEGISKGHYIITIRGTNGEEHCAVTKQ
ncbi:MAG: T9SS type A sorting domain-containing protein [Chitinophagaceae bacterium]